MELVLSLAGKKKEYEHLVNAVLYMLFLLFIITCRKCLNFL